uniref:N-acetylgalactosaminide beta-1,3-galactosyltransferase n=1 Tax=Angiostrongylus cantonensis TaxID=6313 RepID=A0A0K0DF49_ANGCA
MRRWKSSHLVFFCLFFMFTYFLYKVQYKTGIEILPFIPIDVSGFERYNESLLRHAKVSEGALVQKRCGSILCWVMTTSIYHKTRVRAINATWFYRCDASHFFTNSGRFLDESTPYHTIFSELPMSYFKLFWKTRLALYYLYKNVSSEFDWYYKTDDDTYVIMENLRSYLSTLNPNEPHYLGFRLKRRMVGISIWNSQDRNEHSKYILNINILNPVSVVIFPNVKPELRSCCVPIAFVFQANHGYNAGGSGYVISKAALKIFAEKLFHSRNLCPYHEWEDLAVARCLSSVGIYASDTRDLLRRQRFLPWNPEDHYNGDLIKPFLMDPIEHLVRAHHYRSNIFHENLISMHHLEPSAIHLIDGLLYGVAAGMWNKSKNVEHTLHPPPTS